MSRPEDTSPGFSRRGFLGSLGAGALGAAVAVPEAGATPAAVTAAGEKAKLALRVNGLTHRLLVDPRWSLLFVLREQLGLRATKVGCERGECGACTVLVDGVPRYSCLTLALTLEGREITTLEGVMQGEELGPVQRAFVEHDAFQCGYCTPGQVMAAEGLLRANADPTPDQIRLGMSGNLCRCGSYDHIFKAVNKAAALRRPGGER
jgi:xanthine dehydrogenase YagT iron-sulfur-binding subunit